MVLQRRHTYGLVQGTAWPGGSLATYTFAHFGASKREIASWHQLAHVYLMLVLLLLPRGKVGVQTDSGRR